jgi:hypothetical protein
VVSSVWHNCLVNGRTSLYLDSLTKYLIPSLKTDRWVFLINMCNCFLGHIDNSLYGPLEIV